MKKVESLIFNIFLTVGFILLFVGLSLFLWFLNIKSSSVKTKATIINLYPTPVRIKYTANNREYKKAINFYSSNMRVGSKVTIFYSKDNPEKIYTYGFIIAPSILSSLGLIFTLIGGIPKIIKISKRRLKAKLLNNGLKITADITEITINGIYRVNRRSPYLIICQWQDSQTGIIYLFKSGHIWYEPEAILERLGINQLTVYLNPDNYKKYYVDITELEDKVQDLT